MGSAEITHGDLPLMFCDLLVVQDMRLENS